MDASGEQPLDVSSVLEFLDRPVQFIVVRIGNLSTNSAPQLLLPEDPLQVTEDMTFNVQLEVFDEDEDDAAEFYLASLPKLGNASLSYSGFLTYAPCPNCIGMDVLEIYVMERPAIETITPLYASGVLHLEITNRDDAPEIAFYEDEAAIPGTDGPPNLTPNQIVYAYIDANRTTPVIVAQVAAFDYDGYHDDLRLFLQQGSEGSAHYHLWLDAVNTVESLPVSWAFNNSIYAFVGYVTFVGASITYLPSNVNSTGVDNVTLVVRDTRGLVSNTLTIVIEVLPSWCVNDGVCGGSDGDPTCADVEMRRNGFEGYNCSCPPGFEGRYCEISTVPTSPGTDDLQDGGDLYCTTMSSHIARMKCYC